LTHTYVATGLYDVTVTAINGTNESITLTSIIVLNPDLSLFLPLMLKNSSP
jgi:PKD repeat protein